VFSGIVEAVGEILEARESDRGRRLVVGAPFARELAVGESVCTSGVCLTVVARGEDRFETDVSAETLRRSTLGRLRPGDRVNLERSVRLGERLSGHLVLGHVDGIGRLEEIVPEGESALYRFTAPPEVSRYLVEKGSVAVDGVSLTVFGCSGNSFTVALIPHTAAVTTLGSLRPGAPVNLEADLVAKYVEKLARPPS
jgi:riboflavin synthase